MDVAPKFPNLEERQEALGIIKDTHPTEVAWLEKNGELVPWDRVKTLDQLREFVQQRVAQRMELGQYELTAQGTILAEVSEMRALRIKARKGDLEALRAIELYERGGWEMVIKEHFNRKRKSNLDLWKWYLTDENEEYAQDPFWLDLVWDIPEYSWRKKGTFGMGETVDLKPGVLDKLRDDVEFKNIDLPKTYRKLMQQLADSSEEYLPRKRNNKTWIYIPSMEEDPDNYDANVRKLEKLVSQHAQTKDWRGESYLRHGSFWLLRDKRKIKASIYLGEKMDVVWIRDENFESEVPDEYLDDVLNHLREYKFRGAKQFIAELETDPGRQIEIAQSGKDEELRSLALNKNLAPEAQRILCECKDIFALEYLAGNPIITPEVQLRLAKAGEGTILTSLASNPGIIPQVQHIVAENGSDRALENLADNPGVIPVIQIKLAKTSKLWVEKKLARNPNVIPLVQFILTNSKFSEVRADLARNPSIIPQVEKVLVNSKEPWVKENLAYNKSITDHTQLTLVKTGKLATLKILARKEKLCPLAEHALAKSPYPEIRELVSRRPNLSKEARKILETPGYSLQQSKEDAIHAKRQGQTQSQGIAK
jgi:hypothetical protein